MDNSFMLETPEGVRLQWRVAGFSARGIAWVIDFLIRWLVFIVFALAASFIFGFNSGGMILLSVFLLEWLYPIYFEVWRKGQTPGKKIMDLKVVRENGSPVDFSTSLIRNFIRTVDFLPTFYGVGMVVSLIDPKFRRLGDLAAGTMVVYSDHKMSRRALSKGEAIAPPWPLTNTEKGALLDYLDRSKSLGDSRKKELAEILEPLHGRKGEEALRHLNGYAQHVGGKI